MIRFHLIVCFYFCFFFRWTRVICYFICAVCHYITQTTTIHTFLNTNDYLLGQLNVWVRYLCIYRLVFAGCYSYLFLFMSSIIYNIFCIWLPSCVIVAVMVVASWIIMRNNDLFETLPFDRFSGWNLQSKITTQPRWK